MLQNGAVVVAHAVMKFTLLPPEVRTLHPDRQSSGRGCALRLPVLFCSLRSPLTSHTHRHTLLFTAEVVHCCYVCDLSQHKIVSACYCSAAVNKLPQQLSHCLKMHTL